jgi:cytochrome c556
MRLRNVLVALALLAAAGLLTGQAQDPKPGQEPRRGRNVLMQMKLGHAQKVLEGVAVSDFDLILKHAEELDLLSRKAEWKVMQTPEYQRASDDFRRHVADLQKAARAKNLDGAALSYVQLTMSCVNCHKHVREVRMTQGPMPDLPGLPRRGE